MLPPQQAIAAAKGNQATSCTPPQGEYATATTPAPAATPCAHLSHSNFVLRTKLIHSHFLRLSWRRGKQANTTKTTFQISLQCNRMAKATERKKIIIITQQQVNKIPKAKTA